MNCARKLCCHIRAPAAWARARWCGWAFIIPPSKKYIRLAGIGQTPAGVARLCPTPSRVGRMSGQHRTSSYKSAGSTPDLSNTGRPGRRQRRLVVVVVVISALAPHLCQTRAEMWPIGGSLLLTRSGALCGELGQMWPELGTESDKSPERTKSNSILFRAQQDLIRPVGFSAQT